MKATVSSSMCGAVVLASGMAVFAQAGQPATQPSTQRSTDGQITVTGCVQREADYRQARDAGKGGAAGTGIGAGNEFVLASATMAARPGSEASPAGTSGSASAYELTGPNEGQVAQFVGKRVEITGKVKAAEMTPSGKPTGGATAGEPPRGVDVASKDLQLRELEVASVKEATGTCPAK
jgi:hypothetical protein